MTRRQGALEQVWRWRQVAVWAPVAWMPVLLYCTLVGDTRLAISIGLAGLAFGAWTRAVVWLSRCPECGVRWGATSPAFRTLWDEGSCTGCGVSLFELRRARPR